MKRGMRLAWGLLASAAVAAMTACGNQDAGDMDKTAAGTTGQMPVRGNRNGGLRRGGFGGQDAYSGCV